MLLLLFSGATGNATGKAVERECCNDDDVHGITGSVPIPSVWWVVKERKDERFDFLKLIRRNNPSAAKKWKTAG